MSFTDELILPAGARLSIWQKGIFTSFPSAFVYGEHLLEAFGKSLLNARVFFISSGSNIMDFIKSSHCIPEAFGIISPAVKKAAFVYPHVVLNGQVALIWLIFSITSFLVRSE